MSAEEFALMFWSWSHPTKMTLARYAQINLREHVV
ncbi:hypothetical protein SAMN05444158_4762 [Bradyrhizobium canariense]|uniref:Uncharacterized protein n=1 Tax=Bradyrhizobium canariense TaxID=255045 RepID=A0A1H1YDV4_9BRAD|nr:hypothetical protein SAMN05444158_4762 [Bradyrhizobium canariense]